MKKTVFLEVLFCCLLLLFFSFPSMAVMEGLSIEDLTSASEIVIIGTVEKVHSYWNQDRSSIFSRASVDVSEILKGDFHDGKVIIEYQGGEIDGIGLKVSDVSPLKQDERVFLFLKPCRAQGVSRINRMSGDVIEADELLASSRIYNIVGQAQGKYTIGKDKIAIKTGYSLAYGKDRICNNISLDALKEKVRKAK